MRLSRFNEATTPRTDIDWVFFNAVYSDLIEDLREYLDTLFIEFIDKDYECALTRVNVRSKEHGVPDSFYARYRVTMSYKLEEEEKPARRLKTRGANEEPKYNSIESYAEVMRQVSEDLLNLNSCVTHIKDEYDTDSIYGDPFPTNTFETTVNMSMSGGELTVKFVLDIK